MSVPALRFKDEAGQDFPELKEKIMGEIYTFIQTNSFSRELLSYETGTIKNIHYGDIHTKFKSNFKIENENVPFIKPNVDLNKISMDCYCKERDLVIADASEDYADVGKAIEIISLGSQKLLSGLHTYIARDLSEQMSLGFSGYLMQTENVRLQIKTLATGVSVLGISKGNLTKVMLKIPTKPEQTKIANFLTVVDEKITHLTQKHDLLTQYKKGLMQQIFSQELRFKDDDGQDFPEWDEKEVGEVFKVTRGNVLAMPLVSETKTETHQFPVYSSQTKNNGLSGYYNEHLYENSITWTTDGANAGDVNFRDGKFYCTNVCGVLISEDGHANACIAAMINAVSRKYVSYVGNPKLMNGVMAKIAIEFPCVKEQTKIANFLTAIDDKITATQTQLQAVKQYKQGLLQQMFV